MTTLPHPIQYQGSKRHLAPIILRYLPKGINRLIEPFAGSAAITIATAARQLADSYIINDLNKPLAELLCLMVEHSLETASAYETIWHEQNGRSLEHYYQVREEFNRTQNPHLFISTGSLCQRSCAL